MSKKTVKITCIVIAAIMGGSILLGAVSMLFIH